MSIILKHFSFVKLKWNYNLETKYEMRIQFNTHTHTHTYCTYIHTISVIIKNDKNKVHTFYKVWTRALTLLDDWHHDVHSKIVDCGMHINTNAPQLNSFFFSPVSIGVCHKALCQLRFRRPHSHLCISSLLWLKNILVIPPPPLPSLCSVWDLVRQYVLLSV